MRSTFFLSWLNSVADRGRELLNFSRRSPEAIEAPIQELQHLCSELMSPRGEATSIALAREIVRLWDELSTSDRLRFFDLLARQYSADHVVTSRAIKAYEANPNEATLLALNRATEAGRQELIRRINMAPGGTRAIIDMRGELIDLIEERPELNVVNADLEHLLTSWFNRGFLELRQIDWHSPASLLEKLIRYEAVHEIDGWNDLRRRLDSDRRCFAFFHPSIPAEPIIFVEVAIARELSDNIKDLLSGPIDYEAPIRGNTAIFYSISNCQKGLRGISFGSFLIKQVVEEIRRELPEITTFATLSPIPGFVDWMTTQAPQDANREIARQSETVLQRVATFDRHVDQNALNGVRGELLSLCTHYLLKAKRRNRPIDPVARFHLGNGAEIHRINWLANTTAKGMKESAGMMINYVYRLDRIERNHEAFVSEGQIAISGEVKSLLKTTDRTHLPVA